MNQLRQELSDHNPDTQLLAAMLRETFLQAGRSGRTLDEAWYDVAGRAKQLRA